MTKRIIPPSMDSHDDIQQYIALASTLQSKGYKVAGNPAIQEKTSNLGKMIRSERGLENAVRLIEKVLMAKP